MTTWVDRFQWLVAAVTVVFVIAMFAVGPEDSGGGDDGGDDAAAAPSGEAIYTDNCASCHGGDGGGGVGPQLSGGAVVESVGDQAAIEAVITEGRGGMPSFGDRLSPEEISEVAAYISGF